MISGINTNQHYYTIIPSHSHLHTRSLKKVLTVSSLFLQSHNRVRDCASLSLAALRQESSQRGESRRRGRRKLCKISYMKSHWLSQLFSESPLDSERFSFFVTRLCERDPLSNFTRPRISFCPKAVKHRKVDSGALRKFNFSERLVLRSRQLATDCENKIFRRRPETLVGLFCGAWCYPTSGSFTERLVFNLIFVWCEFEATWKWTGSKKKNKKYIFSICSQNFN